MGRTILLAAAAVAAAWLVLLVALAVARPNTTSIKALLGLLPDTVRLVHRLARDPAIARSARWPAWLLLAYLALPIDLVPDFIPVLGYADDVIVVAIVLRRLARRAGPEKLAEHWPGDDAGLDALARLLRLPAPR